MSFALTTFSHYPAIPPPAAVPLTDLDEHECAYLPGRHTRSRAVWASGKMSPNIYHGLMDAGFRRSGRLVYQPTCRACRACVPIRLPVRQFEPSKSQRRTVRKNADLVVRTSEPLATDEKHALYRAYLSGWHGRDDPDDHARETFERFLYDSPVDTIEFDYRDLDGKLLAVGLCDVCEESLSSVYFYFDPRECRRRLGAYGALREIEFAREYSIPYYYLGFWVAGCATMDYKAGYVPHELLGTDGNWRPSATADGRLL